MAKNDLGTTSGGRTLTVMPERPLPKYCAAKNAQGVQCRKYPMKGGTLCRNHFGNTGVQRRNSAKRLELRAAYVALQKVGVDVREGVDPRQVLMEAVAVSHQMLEAVIQMTRSLGVDDLMSIGEVSVPGWANTARGARAEAYLQLVGEWTDRATRVSKTAIDAGLDARMVHLAERQAELLASVVQAALLEAAVPEQVRGPFLKALAAQMRLFREPVVIDLPTAAEAAKAKEVGLPWEVMSGARRVTAHTVEPDGVQTAAGPTSDNDNKPA